MNTISKHNTFRIIILGMCIMGYTGPAPRGLSAAEQGDAGASPTVTIPSGTKIPVRVDENIDGVGQSEGYRFEVYTADLIRTDGTIVIPAGTLMHAAIAKSPKPPDHGLVLYSVRLIDLELRGETYAVVSGTYDIPVDPATNSPYREPVTHTIIPANTILLFTLESPLTVKDDGDGNR